MSDYVQKEGQGSLFRNEYKTKDNQPDMKGTITINGQQYELASWVKHRDEVKGGSWFSISAKPKQQQQKKEDGPNDPIPF